MPGMITVRTDESWFLPVGRIVDVRFAYYGRWEEIRGRK